MPKSAKTSPIPALQLRGLRVSPLRRIVPTLSPLFRQLGGAPRANRRFIAHKIRHSAAFLVLAAEIALKRRRQFRDLIDKGYRM